MTKASDLLAQREGTTKSQANKMIKQVFDLITDCMAEEGTFKVHGFGSFTVKARAERIGRNPATGEPITIPAHNVIVFKASETLNTKINE